MSNSNPTHTPGKSGERPQATTGHTRIKEAAQRTAEALTELMAELHAQGYTRAYLPAHLFIANVLTVQNDKETGESRIIAGNLSALDLFRYDDPEDETPDTPDDPEQHKKT